MAVNNLTFEQVATILNNIVTQATGVNATLTDITTSDFVTVGQNALLAGYDPLSTAISQVLSKTIFAVRPYTAKFKGMEVTEQQFGNITRKLSIVDQAWEEDDRFKLINGQSVDPFEVQKPKVFQENFYGSVVFQKPITIYRDQLDNAFQGPDQFAGFISMLMQNATDMLEQARENTKRATLVNLIAAIVGNYTAQQVHLVTEYNTFISASPALTYADICADPDKYQQFMRFAYARLASMSSRMTERSELYHANVGTDYIMRHSPYEMQRVYVLADQRYNMESMVLADAYHDNYLKLADAETVNFWQNIADPSGILTTPSYLITSGANAGKVGTGSQVTESGVFAVIMDKDACGLVQRNEWADTNWNARGGYTSWWLHCTWQTWNSFTENALVFLLD